MNIDEYREMIAQEAKGAEEGAQVQSGTIATPEQVGQEAPQVQPVQEQPIEQAPIVEEPQIPEVIKMGDAEYKVDELIKAREEAERLKQEKAQYDQMLRESEVAKKYYDKLMENTEYAKAFAQNNGLEFIDPKELQVKQMEQKYNQLLLEKELENMKIKYDDFEPRDVVQFAYDNKIRNLEDAYLLHKAKSGGLTQKAETPDVDAIKEQIRQELLSELQLNVNTGSIIGTAGAGQKNITTSPELTPQELKVARGLNMSPEEYSKWKHNK